VRTSRGDIEFRVAGTGIGNRLAVFAPPSFTTEITRGFEGDPEPGDPEGRHFPDSFFGDVVAPKIFRIGNGGNKEMEIHQVRFFGAGFTLLTNQFPPALAPGETFDFFVSFDPPQPGEYPVTLSVTAGETATGLNTASIRLRAVSLQPALPELSWLPGGTQRVMILDGSTSVNTSNGTSFKDATVGRALTRNFALSNEGQAPMKIDVDRTLDSLAGTPFSIMSLEEDVMSGSASFFTISFLPTSGGATPQVTAKIFTDAPGALAAQVFFQR